MDKRIADASIVSLADVRAKAKELLSRLSLGEDPFAEASQRRNVPTYGEFIEKQYLPHIQRNKRSWKVDEANLKHHILPVLGRLHMGEITRQHAVDVFNRHRDAQKHKESSTNRMITVAHRTFVCALEWEVPGVKPNPMAAVPKLQENNKRSRYLSTNELQRLISELDASNHPRIKEITLMWIYTGARHKEVLNARWSDINFDKAQWRIEFNKSGKTRYVPLSDGAITLLRSVERSPGVEHIFFNPDTKKAYVNIYHAWNRVRKAAGIKDVRVHDLRHSPASFLVNQGRPIYEVQKILGHANVRTTERYAHLSQETLLAATNIVSDIVDDVSGREVEAKPVVTVCEPALLVGQNGLLVFEQNEKENACRKTVSSPFTLGRSADSSNLSGSSSPRRIDLPITGNSLNLISAKPQKSTVARSSL
ncbi:MAG TPA: site-specific integrase [Alcaligenaceae bacterium]|nr:site-specific integrase [Alcaligenaceae bacterium]